MDTPAWGWALVGAGIMGQRMAQRLAASAGLPLLSVWDPSPAARQAWPAGLLAAGLEEALATPGVRWVYVASPPHAHRQAVEAARRRGLPVLCEKPLAASPEDIDALASLAQASPRSMTVNFPFAYGPVLPRLLAARDAHGRSGLQARIRLRMKAWPRPWQAGAHAWLSDPAQGGGYAREVLSHFLFLALRLGGCLRFEQWETRLDASGLEQRIQARGWCGDIPLTVDTALEGPLDDDNLFELAWAPTADAAVRRAALRDWADFEDGAGRCTPSEPAHTVAHAVRAWLDDTAGDEADPPVRPSVPQALASFAEAAEVARWIEALRQPPGV